MKALSIAYARLKYGPAPEPARLGHYCPGQRFDWAVRQCGSKLVVRWCDLGLPTPDTYWIWDLRERGRFNVRRAESRDFHVDTNVALQIDVPQGVRDVIAERHAFAGWRDPCSDGWFFGDVYGGWCTLLEMYAWGRTGLTEPEAQYLHRAGFYPEQYQGLKVNENTATCSRWSDLPLLTTAPYLGRPPVKTIERAARPVLGGKVL